MLVIVKNERRRTGCAALSESQTAWNRSDRDWGLWLLVMRDSRRGFGLRGGAAPKPLGERVVGVVEAASVEAKRLPPDRPRRKLEVYC